MKFFDREGRRISLIEWGRLMEDYDYRKVERDYFVDIEVSTIWLGIEHFGGYWYETMIFGGDHDMECYRYKTHAQAIAGHDQIMAMLRSDAPSGRLID